MTGQSPLRILAITPYAPFPAFGGGKMRIYHLLTEWMRLGHQVELWVEPNDEPALEWGSGDPAPAQRALPGRPRGSRLSKVQSLVSPLPEEPWTRPVRADVLAVESLDRFDVAVLMQAHVGRYAAPLARAGLPVVLDQQNVEAQIARDMARMRPTRIGRIRSRLDEAKWRRFERALERRVQLVGAVSEADAAEFRRLCPTANVIVAPSGADLRRLEFVDHAANRGDQLIMTGTLGYHPNLDAAEWMIDRVLPLVREVRPAAHLLLVGSGVPPSLRDRAGGGVRLIERVPDIRPYLAESDLFVAPLRAGGGTRLKLLEAFAVGLPTVATTIASFGLGVADGVEVATADDEDAFAASIVRLLDDTDARRAMAAAARAMVESRFDWRRIAADYERALRAVAGRGAAKRGA